ncbi:MAG: hypothetical protein QOC89_4071 [Paraburkholderia sp.]|nr:hypothetical protein [Paraburkholderia sp.]
MAGFDLIEASAAIFFAWLFKVTSAAQWLREADGLLITAGASMGVDSGLPDFRGAEGFWRAYPALHAEGVHFEDILPGFRAQGVLAIEPVLRGGLERVAEGGVEGEFFEFLCVAGSMPPASSCLASRLRSRAWESVMAGYCP